MIYEINVADDGAGSLPPEVEMKVSTIEGINSVKVEVVWESIWTPEGRLSGGVLVGVQQSARL